MKLSIALVAAVSAQNDAAYTFNNANIGAVSTGAVTQCTKCEVTGIDTAATYTACHNQDQANGKETCPTGDLNQPSSGANAYVCGFSAVKDSRGEVVALKTGCMQHNVSYFDQGCAFCGFGELVIHTTLNIENSNGTYKEIYSL